MTYIGVPSFRTAIEQFLDPLFGYRIAPIYSSQQRTCNCGVCVRISATHYRIHDAFLQSLSMKKLPKCVLKCNEYPALLATVIAWCLGSGIHNCLHQGSFDLHLRRPFLCQFVNLLSILPSAYSLGNCHSKKGIGLKADRVGMSQRRILLCEFGYSLKIVIVTKHSKRADPH